MVKQGYKETEIGVIPEEWELKHLNDFGDVISGGTPTTSVKEYWDGNVAWCTPSDITSTKGKYIFKTDRYITNQGLRNSAATILPKNSILLCTRATIGELKLSSVPMATNQGFKNLCPDDSGNVEYLYYLLQTKKKEMLELAIGSTFLEISKKALCSIALQTPPLPEQERIAEALSDADYMILSLEKLIAKKRAIKQGAMQELLTGKKRLAGFSGEWDDHVVGKMGDFYSGLSGKSKKDFDCGEAHFITFLNVLSNLKIDTSMLASVDVKENELQNVVKKGDLFFNTSSETPEEVGMCAFLGEELENTYLNSFCFGFRLNDETHDPLFLSYYFNSSIGRKIMSVLAQGATRYNLSKSNFAETIIKLPSKEEQTAIASILSDMDSEIEALEQKLEKTRQVKQGMMQELLTGRIRLV